ncbi:MAG: dTDP-4-amino-4,6-dideoxygalactose transaminase [Bacteroidales bacterium]
MIPFNKPYLTGKEAHYMYQAVYKGHISGNGQLTKKCQNFFKERWGFEHCLLTTSCTDALEMCAMLADINAGDEVIMPSFTFVSTALAFVRQGAHIVFADSRSDHPGIDEKSIEQLITPRTKAIVVVHYAGVACDMDIIMDIAKQHKLLVIEDAAQAIDSYYKGRPLGSIGHLGCFSFHETKNIQCGEGGMLCINDSRFVKRAEILWEKGTNRAEFFRGEVNKYGWIDIGSSFLPADYVAGFLLAQLENIDNIQNRRKEIWNMYYEHFSNNRKYNQTLPVIPSFATNNAHMFYMVFPSFETRTEFISYYKNKQISPVFHYLSLHKSPFYEKKYTGKELPQSDRYTDCLVRMPLYYEIDIHKVLEA